MAGTHNTEFSLTPPHRAPGAAGYNEWRANREAGLSSEGSALVLQGQNPEDTQMVQFTPVSESINTEHGVDQIVIDLSNPE